MVFLVPSLPASLPKPSAPKKATNWIIRITRIRLVEAMPSSSAAKMAETAITVWMPSL